MSDLLHDILAILAFGWIFFLSYLVAILRLMRFSSMRQSWRNQDRGALAFWIVLGIVISAALTGLILGQALMLKVL